MSEQKIQSDIIAALTELGAIPLRLNAGRGRYNQRLLPAGTPDVLAVLPGGRCLWIEVKGRDGTLRGVQARFHETLRFAGHTVIVARSVDNVLDALREMGLY
jgi:hypothetical protein